MGYCNIHGRHDSDGCPDCREAVERAEDNREKLVETFSDLIKLNREAESERNYKINNPGDYDCPYCRFRTLKKNASVCPKCQKDILPAEWKKIIFRDKCYTQGTEVREQRKLLREEIAQRQSNFPDKYVAKKDAKASAIQFAIIYFGYLLPALTGLSVVLRWQGQAVFQDGGGKQVLTFSNAIAGILCPLINWVAICGTLNSPNADLFFPWLKLWIIVGIIILWIIISRRRPV